MIASAQPAWKNQLDRRHRLGTGLLLALTLLASASSQLHAQEPGITPTALRVGGIMDLQGASSARGQAMKAGVEAALKNEKIQGRSIEFIVLNDSFQPPFALEAAKKLIDQGVFVMLGNTGTPTTKAVMPLLAQHQIPCLLYTSNYLYNLDPNRLPIICYEHPAMLATNPLAAEIGGLSLVTELSVSYTHLDVYKRQEFTDALATFAAGGWRTCVKPVRSIYGLGFRLIDDSKRPLERFLANDVFTIDSAGFARLLDAAEGERAFLAMEYLAGDERSIDCLADRGRLVRAIVRRKPADSHWRWQIIEDDPAAWEIAEQAVAAFRLNGLINVQTRERIHEDGRREQCFLEVNPRMSGGIYPVSYTHLDVYKRQTSNIS